MLVLSNWKGITEYATLGNTSLLVSKTASRRISEVHAVGFRGENKAIAPEDDERVREFLQSGRLMP